MKNLEILLTLENIKAECKHHTESCTYCTFVCEGFKCGITSRTPEDWEINRVEDSLFKEYNYKPYLKVLLNIKETCAENENCKRCIYGDGYSTCKIKDKRPSEWELAEVNKIFE